jgi:hypothetical protein
MAMQRIYSAWCGRIGCCTSLLYRRAGRVPFASRPWKHAFVSIAALAISIIAIIVAGLSAWFTRQQAEATEGTRRIEADRRHQELTPNAC